jgi:exosortase A-associated hydrolase 2
MLDARFLPGAKGPIFVTMQGERATAQGCVLVLPPFAEEMNKSRRMLCEVSQALAKHGMVTVLPDLYGTGDSGGEFCDATWALWLDDLLRTCAWCNTEGIAVTHLLAVRLGGALANSLCATGAFAGVQRTVFWQPSFDGKRALQQFLRLRVAAAMMEDRKETLQGLQEQLQRGATLEVAGYSLAAQLAAELTALSPPAQLPTQLGAVHWLEVVADATDGLAVPSQKLLAQWQAAGTSAQAAAFAGEPFWASTEIVGNAELLRATVNALVPA